MIYVGNVNSLDSPVEVKHKSCILGLTNPHTKGHYKIDNADEVVRLYNVLTKVSSLLIEPNETWIEKEIMFLMRFDEIDLVNKNEYKYKKLSAFDINRIIKGGNEKSLTYQQVINLDEAIKLTDTYTNGLTSDSVEHLDMVLHKGLHKFFPWQVLSGKDDDDDDDDDDYTESITDLLSYVNGSKGYKNVGLIRCIVAYACLINMRLVNINCDKFAYLFFRSCLINCGLVDLSKSNLSRNLAIDLNKYSEMMGSSKEDDLSSFILYVLQCMIKGVTSNLNLPLSKNENIKLITDELEKVLKEIIKVGSADIDKLVETTGFEIALLEEYLSNLKEMGLITEEGYSYVFKPIEEEIEFLF